MGLGINLNHSRRNKNLWEFFVALLSFVPYRLRKDISQKVHFLIYPEGLTYLISKCVDIDFWDIPEKVWTF